ncbi:myosin heavy chain, non-muscle-like isoform X3 [Zootermopsis nevadensis]|nr:myosin heavy chain, non-muscle-like isoform X3 [Zootermopsis nevadensis]
MRRHPDTTFMQLPAQLCSETERLQSEIKELKERLNNTERLLQKESSQNMEGKKEAQSRGDDWSEEEKRQMKEWQQEQQRKYLDEIADLKTVFYNEIKRLKEHSQQSREPTPPSNAELLEQITKQDKELVSLREKLSGQVESTPDLENMQSRMEAQERFWKSKLKQMETEHKRELEEFRTQLDQATDMIAEFHSNNHQAEYENRILELMAHIVRQDETLKAQVTQVDHLTEQLSTQIQQTDSAQQQTVELQPQSSENASVDPRVTFTELTARIDKAIHANKYSPDRVNRRQSAQTSVKTQAKSIHSMSKTPVSVRNIPLSRDNVMVRNITSESKHSAEGPQEDSSSDLSHQTMTTRTGTTSMYGLIDQGKVRSPQGSKDSGLDSPKRFPTIPIRKINAFQGLSSIETTPITSGSEDRVDNVDDVTQSEDEEEEKDETISDEATADETETDTDTEPAVTSVHSLEDELQQKPQMLTELKKNLQRLHDRRLRELGVDPEWKGIPAATFCQKMATLKHHQTIAEKKHKSFFKIRERIVDELERRLSNTKTDSQQGKSDNGGKVLQRDSTQQNKVAMKKFAAEMKTKALKVLKRSTGKLSIHSEEGSQKANSQDTAMVSVHQKDPFTSKQKMQNISIMKKRLALHRKNAETGKRSNVISGNPATVSEVDNRSVEESAVPNVTMVTSTPFKNTKTPSTSISARSILKGSLVSESVGGKKNVKSPSISSMEEEEEEEDDDVSEHTIIHQTLQHTQDPHTHSEKKPFSSLGVITRDLSSDEESPRANKSVLKSPLSSSLGSITKKRVLFVDQENEMADNSRTKRLPWTPDNIKHYGYAGSYEQINLSTKQSAKIAQISKNIEEQLRMSRSKPPTGSVEAMFRSTGSEKSSQYQGTDLSSPSLDSFMSDTNHENNTNLSNTTSAPVPKPRSNKPITATQQTSSKLPLSDWDLEDFDNYT